MAIPERLVALLAQNQVTGIDFVYVYDSQVVLDVYFLRSPATLTVPLVGNLTLGSILIYSPSGGDALPVVPVSAIGWTIVNGRDVLRITTSQPGDFSRYRLQINDARIDRYFNNVWFSFKANCPSDLDCEPPPHECPPDPAVDFPVDYSARDFWSFRRALLDFVSQRYSEWQDRLEADVGNMFAEVLAAVGDEFAYNQDRIAREAYLETATQRRSLRRHASLVDYHVHDGFGASTWLDFAVNFPGNIPAGTLVSDALNKIHFETGRGFAESFAIAPALPRSYAVDPARNRLLPHQWDEEDVCLPVGSTELFIQGAHAADLPLDDTPAGQPPGRWVLLLTKPADPAVKARALMVRLITVEDTFDLVLPPQPNPITRLVWQSNQSTPFELDMTVLEVHGNLIPATAGATQVQRFTIGPSVNPVDRPSAVERGGPDGSVAHMFSLPNTDTQQIVFLGDSIDDAAPELRLLAVTLVGGNWVPLANGEWNWRRELLGTNSSLPTSTDYRLDDGFWRRVVGYQRSGSEIVHIDYATGDGKTIRFGDGQFGALPADGTVFQASYRLGLGADDNVTAGTLTSCALAIVAGVTNPLPAAGGADPETPQQVLQAAPEAYQSITYRAVRPEDYAEALERLDWVQRAGAAFRWTGSWLTAYATPDPLGAFSLSDVERQQADEQLDRFRQAGRPAYVLNPVYANLDLQIRVCVETSSFQGEVEERVLQVLFGSTGIRPRPGFFSPDNFTFGTPLERSQLEAAIQQVTGVKAVEDISIRRRGWFDWREFTELTFKVGTNELIRLANDPQFPDRGSLKLAMDGGA